MKVIHIEARLKAKFELPKEFIEKLPKKVAIFTTIQLMNTLPIVAKQLEETGRTPVILKTGHTRHKGQILGCNVQRFEDYTDEEFDAFLYVGDGFFHPKALVWKNEDKKVHVYNPFTSKEYLLDGKDIEKTRKQYLGALSSFRMSNKIGVLVSTKPGQFFLKRALELKKEYPEKKFYYFTDNTINFDSLEDFPFIQVWVNTACPRIPFEDQVNISKPVVNLEDVRVNDKSRAVVHEKIGKINVE